MAKLEVKYDPTLEQSEIIARLDNTSEAEVGENFQGNQTGLQQTSIYGIQCPIIAVNNVMIAYEDILSFTLDDTRHIPRVDMHINDRKSIIEMLDTPGNDNELRVQILPPFDNIYKKINLTFLITKFSQGLGKDLYISGIYKLSKFTSSQFKSLGEVSLYELFDTIASESRLGLATNTEDSGDKRFVYCPYLSYQDIIEKEISHSGDQTIIYDWWIDVWNYLNLANIYERYTTIDSEDDMKIWISNQTSEVSEGIEIIPQENVAELTNLFGTQASQLYVKDYRIINNPGLNVIDGTDKIYSVYSMNNNEYQDTYISDGDVKKDIFENFEYKGEVYGNYDYITCGMYRSPFLQKIKSSLIEVDLDQPLLGIQRGNHVLFSCYYNDSLISDMVDAMADSGVVDKNTQTEVPMTEMNETDDSFKLNKSISGQYMVLGNTYKFSNKHWTQTVILTRPIDQKPKLLIEE